MHALVVAAWLMLLVCNIIHVSYHKKECLWWCLRSCTILKRTQDRTNVPLDLFNCRVSFFLISFTTILCSNSLSFFSCFSLLLLLLICARQLTFL